MIYELSFHPDALAEWQKLDGSVRVLFKKKLTERLLNPHVLAARLSGQKNRYKIKLRDAGYRLVYESARSSVGGRGGRRRQTGAECGLSSGG